jgi:preprotein translocase subunit SecE
MKKKNKNSVKKKSAKPQAGSAKVKQKAAANRNPASQSVVKPAITRSVPRRVSEKKGQSGRSLGLYIQKAGQFLREAKMELKKVKWPTRKELLATTAVVILLVLFCALYLGLVDFGLIKLIKNIVG